MMFTDVQQTGSTFTAKTLEEAQTKLGAMREKFAVAEVPIAEPGRPEAGLQTGMFGRDVEFRPAGRGREVQISMEDQLKLQTSLA